MKFGQLVGLGLIIVGFSMLGGKSFVRYYRHANPPIATPTQRNELVSLLGRGGYDMRLKAQNPDLLQYFTNANGRSQMDMGIYHNTAMQNMYDPYGTLRVQFAIYNSDVRSNEEGLPVAGLYDSKGKMRLLLRLDGSEESPLIIFKDSHENNRSIFGLDINSSDNNPFLVLFNQNGEKSVHFGQPSSPGNPIW